MNINVFKKITISSLSLIYGLSTMAFTSDERTNYLAKQSTDWECNNVLSRANNLLATNHLIANMSRDEANALITSEERMKRLLDQYSSSADPYKLTLNDSYYQSVFSFLKSKYSGHEFCDNMQNLYFNVLQSRSHVQDTINKMNQDKEALKQKVIAASEKFKTDPDKAESEALKLVFTKYPTNETEKESKIIHILAREYKKLMFNNEPSDSAFKAALRVVKNSIVKAKYEAPDLMGINLYKALLASVDTHNSYYTKEELKEFMDSMTSGFVGIGIQILTSGNGIRVVGVIKDGPADKSGQLKERDVIVAIDGDANKATLPLTEATKFLKGKPGSTVSVDIERDGKVIKDIVITRGTVNTASNATKSEVIEKAGKKLGYLTFSSFFSGNYKLGIKGIAGVVKDKLAELNNQNIEGLVLDLRNNPGGSLHDVVDILGQLIGPNTFVQTLNYRGSHDYLKSYEKNVFDKPLVVMVNEGSASASEVLAGNLKDFNRALVVGTKSTFGKGLVQTVDTDPFTNDAHKLTTSGYYLASGSSPQYSGVESDVVITASDEDSISERTINPLMKDFPPLDSLFKLKAAKKWLGDSEMNWVRTKMAQTNYLTTVNDKDTQKEVEKEQAFKVLVNYMSFLQKASSDPNYDLAEAN